MSTTVDDYSPIMTGDTLAPLVPSFTKLVNGVPAAYDLSGLTLSLKMMNEAGTIKTGAGTWTIDDATNGLAHYTYASTDVDTAGTWTLYIKLTNGSGASVHALTKTLEILSAP